VPDTPIQDVLEAHRREIHAVAGVVGLSEGALEDGTPCVLVMVEGDAAEAAARLPDHLGGYPVVVRTTGSFEARPGAGD